MKQDSDRAATVLPPCWVSSKKQAVAEVWEGNSPFPTSSAPALALGARIIPC